MRYAILHAGLHKTGTSSVQITLSRNRKLLLGRGWRYAAFTQYGRDSANHSNAFFNLFTPEDRHFQGNIRAKVDPAAERLRLQAELDANLAAPEHLIFSAEAISLLDRPALERMKARFEEAGRTLRIILSIRPPTPLLHSLAHEAIKQGAVLLDPATSLHDVVRKRVEAILSVFPEAEVHPFAEMVAHPLGPAGHLLETLEPGLSDGITVHRANDRMSLNAAEVIRQINRAAPMVIRMPAPRVNPLRVHGDVFPLLRLSGPPFRMHANYMKRFAPQVKATNAWLTETFGDAYADRNPEPPRTTDVEWEEHHARELRRLLALLPRHLRAAAVSLFEDRDDIPAPLLALARRHSLKAHPALRLVRGAPGVGVVERRWRKLRGEW